MHPALADRQAARSAALDLHEGIADPRVKTCGRWPEHLRLMNCSTGELLPGRCKATNLCAYCARLYAVETAEMVLLDAMEDAPTIYCCLTSRAFLTRSEVRDHLHQLRKAGRASWPLLRWFVSVEFTQAGRLHVNLLVKGVPIDQVEELKRVLVERWCARVDARPIGQCVKPVTDSGGIVKYVALHFLKESQAPPIGWRGHRTSQTRDYLVRPASVMRDEARKALRLKRLLWRGVPGELAALELEIRESHEWKLRGVNPSSAGTGRVRPRRAEPEPLRESTRGNPGGKVAGAFGRPPLPGSIDQEEEHE